MEKVKRGDIVIAGNADPVIGIVSEVSSPGDKINRTGDIAGVIDFRDGDVSWWEIERLRKIDLSNVASAITYKGENCIDVMSWDSKNGQAKRSRKDNFNFLYSLCLAASRIKKPWPQKGDTVYFINRAYERVEHFCWHDGDDVYYDGEMLKAGKIFKTREAAEAALEKIKAVFAANKEALERD